MSVKRLAVIPARGGSKRIPGKNIRPFAGKPILAHVLDNVRASEIFDEVHVSTDCLDIAGAAAAAGYSPAFVRPAELADDYTPIFEVFRYVTEEYGRRGKEFDTLCLLYPTAPLMSADDIRQACLDFEQGPKDKALMSVTEFPCPVEWAFRRDEEGSLIPIETGGFLKRSQDLQPAYFDSAMFVFCTRDFLCNTELADMYKNMRGYVVPASRTTDIDTMEDWELAENMYAALKGHGGR